MPDQKEPDVKMWQERIMAGLKFQSDFGCSGDWGTYKELYRQRKDTRSYVMVNTMFQLLRSMVPQVYFRNPRVTATARKPGLQAELNARIVQKLDNWLLSELATKRQFKKMVEDNFFCGTSTGFIGYDSMYGFDSQDTDATGQYTLTQFDKSGNKIEFNARVNPGMPWFLRARPEDVIFPSGCTDKESAEWVALRLFRKLDDLKKDTKYANTKDLSSKSSPLRTTAEGVSSVDIREYQQIDEGNQWVELWEIHDLRTGKIKVITLDCSKFLRDDPDEMQIEGLPIENLTFNPDPDYIYGVPDARIIYPQFLELNDIRSQAQKHRRVNLIRAIVNEDALSQEEIQKFTSDKVQAVIRAKMGATTDIRNVIASVSPGVSGILQDLNMQGEVARGDIRETVGFSRNASGEYQGKTHISAEETKQVFKSLNIRLDERRDQMADLLTGVVRKWNQLIFTHWSQEKIIDIIGPDGAKWWIKYKGTEIKDEYNMYVEAEEGAPMDKGSKLEAAMEAARVWAELNQGAIKNGMSVPPELQRLIFNQFEETGLDVDKLVAQTNAMNMQTQNMQAMQNGGEALQQKMGGAGASPDNPVSVGDLSNAMSVGG